MLLLTDKFKMYSFIIEFFKMNYFAKSLLLLKLLAVPLETLENTFGIDSELDQSVEEKLQDGNQTYLVLSDFEGMRPAVLFQWPFQDRISLSYMDRLGGSMS